MSSESNTRTRFPVAAETSSQSTFSFAVEQNEHRSIATCKFDYRTLQKYSACSRSVDGRLQAVLLQGGSFRAESCLWKVSASFPSIFFFALLCHCIVWFVSSIKERTELRERLQCKPFSWFLAHVYPELKYVSKLFVPCLTFNKSDLLTQVARCG